jgi:DNA-binding CsgD family transcriptional regulator
METWSLLVLVLAVAAGLITATLSGLVLPSRGTPIHRYFLAGLLLFNLLILAGLVFRYVQLRLSEEGLSFPPTVLVLLLVVMAALKLGWLSAFIWLNATLGGREPDASDRRRLLAAIGVALAAWAVLLIASTAYGLTTVARVTIMAMEIVVIVGAVGACLVLLARSGSLPQSPRRRWLRLFGGLHLTIFVLMIVSLGIGWTRTVGQTSLHVLINAVVMVFYNLSPLLWLPRVVPPAPDESRDEAVRYGITRREREIIALICEGRTNQEIADRLFISLATVKDHNYNIFRKTGVKNRVELVNLFRPSR